MHGTSWELLWSICVVGLDAAMLSRMSEVSSVSAKKYRQTAESAASERQECEEGCGKICRSPLTDSLT